jgi:hypothetical protein
MYPENLPRALLQRAAEAEAFADWLRSDPDALVDAADLLGGLLWRERAETVVVALREGDSAFRHLPALRRLSELLTLCFVDDPFSPEARRFAGIHPDHPRADNARRCAERLVRGVALLSRLSASAIDEAA